MRGAVLVAVWLWSASGLWAALPDWIPSPANISGSYSGSWSSASASVHFPTPRTDLTSGPYLLRIQSYHPPQFALHYLRGDLLLRPHRDSASKDELRFSVSGLYYPPEGYAVLYSNINRWRNMSQADYLLKLTNTNMDEFWSNVTAMIPADSGSSTGSTASTRYSKCTLAAEFVLMGQRSGELQLPAMEQGSLQHSTLQDSYFGVAMNGNISSASCMFSAEISSEYLDINKIISKAVNYAIVISIFSVTQVVVLIKQMEVSLTQSRAAKISMLCIGLQGLVDAFLSLFHLTTAMIVDQLFNPFVIAAMLEFVTFSMFEMRLLLVIWRARRPEAFESWETARRELGFLYLKFYSALLVTLFLFYYMSFVMPGIILIAYSFWIPQIIHNAQSGSNKSLQPLYVITTSLLRLFMPLCIVLSTCCFTYIVSTDVYGCPDNFLGRETNYPFTALITLYVGLQVGILFVQDDRGPRFFVPDRFLPDQYNYYRSVQGRPADEMCTICMMEIWNAEQTAEDNPEAAQPAEAASIPDEEQSVKLEGDVMICPCNHAFHDRCLKTWMEHKMECPTCRRPLPPP